MYYCHTHGLGHNEKHTGHTCKFPGPNHIKQTTYYNMMGGCNRIHRLKDEKALFIPYHKKGNTADDKENKEATPEK